ncbi:MAG: tetratricopeptide repeat protein [Caulobacter sp.]|nr:tetratricopeptide repeat protein [Caulobacter sp.]
MKGALAGLGSALTALVLTAAAAPAESNLEQYFRLRQEAGKAAQADDLATAETKFEAALALYPTSPGSFIRLARVEVAAGKPDEAIAHLAAYARLGLAWDIAGDPVLKALIDRPDFSPVAARLTANADPVGAPQEIATLGPAGAVYEGIVHVDGGWVMSSVAGRSLLRRAEDGQLETLLSPDAETGGLFGMAVSADGKVLWVTESRGPGIPGSTGAPRTGLLKVSLPDGKVLARYFVPEDGKKHQLGDVVIGEDGAVYASDGVGAVIYRLKPGGLKLEPLVASRDMASPQGMAICPGGAAMVVADYSSGLHRIDLKTGAVTPVGGMRAAMAGTDGLFRIEHDFGMRNASPLPVALVATQNGITPARVVFLRLSPDCDEIEDLSVVASGHPGMGDLTLGAFGEGAIVFIGSSGWAGYDGEGKSVAGEPGEARLLLLPPPYGD